jgi:pimeloyl-ACP methyl ester carboxylesterase
MNILLIHGGWQGGWCWDQVVAELERGGHRVFAPTLPGLEPGAVDRSESGLGRYIAAMTQLVTENELTDLVVVGHSGGGPVAQGVVEHCADRVSRLVIVDGWVLQDGERINDVLAPEMADGFRAAAAATPDRTVPMPEEFWLQGLCNDQSAEEARSWLDRVVPCPIGWFEEPISLPTPATRDVASAYIFLDEDLTVERTIYETMAARLKNPATTTCPGAHEAMLSQPAALAEAIVSVAS